MPASKYGRSSSQWRHLVNVAALRRMGTLRGSDGEVVVQARCGPGQQVGASGAQRICCHALADHLVDGRLDKALEMASPLQLAMVGSTSRWPECTLELTDRLLSLRCSGANVYAVDVELDVGDRPQREKTFRATGSISAARAHHLRQRFRRHPWESASRNQEREHGRMVMRVRARTSASAS